MWSQTGAGGHGANGLCANRNLVNRNVVEGEGDFAIALNLVETGSTVLLMEVAVRTLKDVSALELQVQYLIRQSLDIKYD